MDHFIACRRDDHRNDEPGSSCRNVKGMAQSPMLFTAITLSGDTGLTAADAMFNPGHTQAQLISRSDAMPLSPFGSTTRRKC
jgi:hypothetical protein